MVGTGIRMLRAIPQPSRWLIQLGGLLWLIAWAAPLLADSRAPTSNASLGWERLSIPLRYRHSAIYDPVREHMVVFGGITEGPGCCAVTVENDVWILTPSGAESFRPVGGGAGLEPSPRTFHTAIYDPLRERMIIFGGSVGEPEPGIVWALSLETNIWERIVVSGPEPSPRQMHSAIYDPVGDRMIVFGGIKDSVLVDTWALSLGGTPAWSELATTGGAPTGGRFAHTAVYDAVRHRMVIDGGWSSLVVASDTWVLDLGSLSWSTITHDGPPLPGERAQHRAVYDPVRDRMLIYYADAVRALPFDPPGPWTTVVTGREDYAELPSMVWDSTRDQLIFHGGTFLGINAFWTHQSTWFLTLSPLWWTEQNNGTPASGVPAIYVPTRDWFLLFSGNVIRVRPFGSPSSWTTVQAGSGPNVSSGVSTIYDASRDRMVAFGGGVSDAWALSFAGTPVWNLLATSGDPPTGPRSHHTTVYDASRDRMLLFGGVAPTTPLVDYRELDFTSLVWTKPVPAGPEPPPRQMHAAIFDPVGDRMIIFGGLGLNDLWALDFSAGPVWEQLTPAGAPPPAATGSESVPRAIYDPIARRMIVATHTGLWGLSLDGPLAWTSLGITGQPAASQAPPILAYDSLRDRMLFMAYYWGGGHTLPELFELWALNWGRVVGVDPVHPIDHMSFAPPFPNPSNGTVRFRFNLVKATHATLQVFDLTGRLVATVTDRPLTAGAHTLEWKGRAQPGLYFAVLRTPQGQLSRRVAVIR